MADRRSMSLSKRLTFFLLVVFGLVSAIAYVYSSLAIPIGVSLFFSYVLAPLVDHLEKRVSRTLTVSLLLISMLLLCALISITIIPDLYQELSSLVTQIPGVVSTIQTRWIPYLQSIIKDSSGLSQYIGEKELSRIIQELSSMGQISERASQALTTIWNSLPRIMSLLLNLIITPFLTFFLLLYWKKIKTFLAQYIPHQLKHHLDVLGYHLDHTLSGVIKGQVTVAAIMGIFYIIGFWLIGMEAAISIGVIAGICRIIPYFDVLIGGSLGIIALLADYKGIGPVLWLGVIFATVQTIDGTYLTPRIIGEKVGLHPAVVIASVLAFGSQFGFWGVLFAIPIVAIFKSLWVAMSPFYFSSRFYKDI